MRMTSDLSSALTELRIDANSWQFCDLRLDIPADSFGSDAINPHTQYSNPIAIMRGRSGMDAFGSSFTLGRGNDLVCMAAHQIVKDLDGATVADLIASPRGFYETLTNPAQLRWLSPNAGLPLMAAGLVVNTLIDAAAKEAALPAWEYMAKLPTELIISLVNLRHLGPGLQEPWLRGVLDRGMEFVEERCQTLRKTGIPVYFTTWIGHTAEQIAGQIDHEYRYRGIRRFKVKISPDLESDAGKLREIRARIPVDAELCVDANQTLSFQQATEWLQHLADNGIGWLEEPFAPDNLTLFSALADYRTLHGLRCEIATGENCPNYFTAESMMALGLTRFQPDPCRMLGMVDALLVACLASAHGCPITPHAGGSSLDELSPHIQFLNLARVDLDTDPSATWTENVGFCSKYFAAPTSVVSGRALAPSRPGLLVGLSTGVSASLLDYREGVTWLEL